MDLPVGRCLTQFILPALKCRSNSSHGERIEEGGVKLKKRNNLRLPYIRNLDECTVILSIRLHQVNSQYPSSFDSEQQI